MYPMKGMYNPPLSSFVYGRAELVLLTLAWPRQPPGHKRLTI